MKQKFKTVCVPAAAAVALIACAASAADWPQLQHDAQRSGYTAEEVGPPYTGAYVLLYDPDRLCVSVQPILYDNKVFVGTKSGNLYANDAKNGAFAWKAQGDGPIVHSAAAADGRVFFGCLGGGASLHAVSAEDGAPLWTLKTSKGFMTAPLIAENKVFAAGKDGSVFALAPENGAVLWKVKLPAPVLNTPCYDNGKVFVACEDMRVHALEAGDGKKLWESEQLHGLTFQNYWPVAHKNKVVIRSMCAVMARGYWNPADYEMPFPWGADYWFDDLVQAVKRCPKDGKLSEDEIKQQDMRVEFLEKNPFEREMFVLDADTGRQSYIPPSWPYHAMSGAFAPVAIDRDGYAVLACHFLHNTWGRFDLDLGRFVEVFISESHSNTRPDETFVVSCSGRYAMVFHMHKVWWRSGVWDIDEKQFYFLGDAKFGGSFGNIWDPNSAGDYSYPRLRADGEPLLKGRERTIHRWGPVIGTNGTNNRGNPPAIGYGMVFHLYNGQLHVRKPLTEEAAQ